MPSDQQATHQGLTINFKEDIHKYFIPGDDTVFTSVTTFIHSFLPQFYSDETAERLSGGNQQKKAAMLLEWQKKADYASFIGTRTHENCEEQLKTGQLKHLNPIDEHERNLFRNAFNAVRFLIDSGYELLTAEQIVFSRCYGLAGSVDLIMRKDGVIYIFDWKTNKEIKKKSFNDQKGSFFPVRNVPDANYYHYSLQLNLYEKIMKDEEYIHHDQQVKRALIHITDENYFFHWIDDMTIVVQDMIIFKLSNRNVPF